MTHILGHTQVKTTQRYAHLANETLLAAANAATHAVGSVMRPKLVAAPALIQNDIEEDLCEMLLAIEAVQAVGRQSLGRQSGFGR